MNVLIVEDEIPAAEKLQRMLLSLQPDVCIVGIKKSISTAVAFLKEHQDLDLILMDIQLVDGQSFEIFAQVEVLAPVVFITAFDQYAIEAFKSNGIDYLLKPLQQQDLEKSLAKMVRLQSPRRIQPAASKDDLSSLFAQLTKERSFKERFLVKFGEHIRSVDAADISLFHADGRIVYIIVHEKAKYVIDYKMETLEQVLNPKAFFRINRSLIVNLAAIQEVLVYSNSRLKVILKLQYDQDVIVSREKVNSFKRWFAGES